jgi:exopolyphosphatase/pppGpp-phosphohydrolase
MVFPPEFDPQFTAAIQASYSLAETCTAESGHSQQVTRLALRLFDDLQPLHNFGEMEKYWLYCAAILHDIGWLEGQKGHHKISQRIILTSTLLPFTNKERLIIGSIARYHRRALPSLKHDHFAALTGDEQEKVTLLAAFLRQADGMDYAHQNRVQDLTCKIQADKITITCLLNSPANEAEGTKRKSDLLALVSQRKVKIRWISAP